MSAKAKRPVGRGKLLELLQREHYNIEAKHYPVSAKMKDRIEHTKTCEVCTVLSNES